MINRTLVRTKVVQTIFSFNSERGQTAFTAEKVLVNAFTDTYRLYFLLLDLVNELTQLAVEDIEQEMQRAQIMHEDYNPNPRFVNNRFAAQLFENKTLRHYLQEYHLGWDVAHESLNILYKQIKGSTIYQEYMNSDISSYEADKVLWRKLFCFILADNSDLENALEELEIALDAKNWGTDMDVIISYIVKTIKRFDIDKADEQPLLEMFDTEEEFNFAKSLLHASIEHANEYNQLVASNLQNWDAERMALMDKVILQVALAEIFTFPDIAVQVTLNEYIDIAREYSTENSPHFINGILDQILQQLKAENKLLKAVIIK